MDATPRLDFDHLREYLANPTPERLAYIFAALRRGFSVEEIHALTCIDRWFLSELADFIRKVVLKVGEGRPNVMDLIAQGKVNLVVNTPSSGQNGNRRPAPPLPATAEERGLPLPLEGKRTVGYRIRTAALDYHIPYVTTLVALRATVAAIRSLRSGHLPVRALDDVVGGTLKA